MANEAPPVDVQEAQTRAALRTDIARVKTPAVPGAPVAPVSLTEQRTDTLAHAVAERQALSASGEIMPEVMSDAEARRAIQDIFDGQDRTPGGLLTDTRLRHAEAGITAADVIVRKLAKEGYGSLTDAQKAKVRDRIDNGINRLPGLSDLPRRGTPERQAVIEAWLLDPTNKEFYAEALREEEKVLTGKESSEDAAVAKEEIKDAEIERTEILQKIANVQELKEQVDRDMERFDVRIPGAADPSKGEVLDQLNHDISNAQAVFEATTTKIQIAQKRIEALTLARQSLHNDRKMNSADRQVELDRITNAEGALQTELNDYVDQQAIAKATFEAARVRREPLVAERAKLQQNQDGLSTEWENLLIQYNANEIRLGTAMAVQLEASGDITLLPDRVLNSLERAFVNVIERRMEQDATTFTEELDKIKAEAKDAATAALADGVRKKFFKPARARGMGSLVKGHESSKYDKKTIGEYWGKFLTDSEITGGTTNVKGAEAVVEQVLLASGMARAEVDAKLADVEYMKDATPYVMGELIRLRARTGSQLSENEVEFVNTFTWSEKIFENALSKNSKAQEMLDDLNAKGQIEGKTFAALRRADRDTILKILLALFGSAAIGAGMLGVGGVVAVAAGGGSLAKALT